VTQPPVPVGSGRTQPAGPPGKGRAPAAGAVGEVGWGGPGQHVAGDGVEVGADLGGAGGAAAGFAGGGDAGGGAGDAGAAGDVADGHGGERGGGLAGGLQVGGDEGEVGAHPGQGGPQVGLGVPHRVVGWWAEGRGPAVATGGVLPAGGHELQQPGCPGGGVGAGVPAGLHLDLRGEPQQRDGGAAGLAFLLDEGEQGAGGGRQLGLVDPDQVRRRALDAEPRPEEQHDRRRCHERGDPPARHGSHRRGARPVGPGGAGTEPSCCSHELMSVAQPYAAVMNCQSLDEGRSGCPTRWRG
jgi:hypothetical protein